MTKTREQNIITQICKRRKGFNFKTDQPHRGQGQLLCTCGTARVKADEINISATGNNLSISGDRKMPSEGENVRYHREAGTFNRIIALPGEVDTDRVVAKHVNGILTVVIPKAETAKPKQIAVR